MTSRWIFRLTLVALLGIAGSAGVALLNAGESDIASRPLGDVLIALGEAPPSHRINPGEPARAASGLELLTRGRTITAAGDSTTTQSPFFRCVDCHLLEREDPTLAASDPVARLAAGAPTKRRLLPGVTLYGVVNKTSWYEGYERKYGDLVKAARTDLRAAIQLCSRECSQGRELESWELDAVLGQLWALQYRVSDLDLTAAELTRLEAALRADGPDPATVALLRGKFLDRTPATFLKPVEFVAGAGDPAAGQLVYERSCLSCHGPAGPSKFDMSTLDGWDDVVHALKAGELLQAVRDGVPPPEGRKGRYMPEFTAERLSDGQLRDLVAWIERVGAGTGASNGADNTDAGSAPPASALAPAAVTAAVQSLTTGACGSCHGKKAGPEWVKFDYVEKLDRLAAQKKYIVPGRPEDSKLYRMVAGLEKPVMPHKRAPLEPAEVALIHAWIQGLPPAAGK